MPIDTYQQALDWLYSFVRFDESRKHIPGGGDLARMARLLDRLGAPQKRYRSIVIAGTKGKGSTAAMLGAILRAAGYRTGLFTSPHLHTFRERIRVNDELISRAQVIQYSRRLEELVADYPDVIWFELVTALALEFFADQQIEIAVLEVGLGGRLDATNVVNPLVSVITPISYDHMDVLGHTLAAIAFEKAGIIKPATPVVVSPQEPEAAGVIERVAQENRAPLVQVGSDWKWDRVAATLEGQRFRLWETGEESGPTSDQEFFIPLLGPHQLINATTALAAAEELERTGIPLNEGAMRQGLERVEWPVRFEVLDVSPLIIADGAHNRASAHELARTLAEVAPGQKIELVFGASNDKDIRGMLEELLPLASSLILTRSRHVRAADPNWLARIAETFGVPTIQTENVRAALAEARRRAGENGVICISGSLFVAAESRAAIRAEQGKPVETDDD